MKWTEGNAGKYSIGDYVVEYGTGDHNFCRYITNTLSFAPPFTLLSQFRAPDHTNPWCYLEAGDWEDCAIPLCEEEQSSSTALITTSSPVEDCLTTIQGFDYRGSQSKTVSGMFDFTSSCKHHTLGSISATLVRFFNLLLYVGATCMNWISNGKYHTGKYVTDFGTGDHNHCRWQYLDLKTFSLQTYVVLSCCSNFDIRKFFPSQ